MDDLRLVPERLPASAFEGSAWYLTLHAIDRWQERYEPETDRTEAARRLAGLSTAAIDTGAETRDGRALYLHADWPAVRFVVARPAPDEDRPSLLTVIDTVPTRERRGSRSRHGRRRG